MSEHIVECPSCGKPLRVSAETIGKTGHCSFCRTAFHIPAAGNGPGVPVVIPHRGKLRIPRALAVPAFGLMILGAAGMMVNGLLTMKFVQNPGEGFSHAKLLLRQIRMEQEMVIQSSKDRWEHAPHAAVAGAAAAWSSREDAEETADERLAHAMAPRMVPVHAVSFGLSAISFLGGAMILFRRLRALAILGCLAAALNVNHLCCLPGGIVGIWGFLVLIRDESSEYFRVRQGP